MPRLHWDISYNIFKQELTVSVCFDKGAIIFYQEGGRLLDKLLQHLDNKCLQMDQKIAAFKGIKHTETVNSRLKMIEYYILENCDE